jgi:hypothetical protein
MAKGDPPTSPWTFYDSGSDYQGKHITASVTWSGAWTGTNALTGGTVTRDAGCVYTKVIIGALNPDGTPASGSKVIDMSGFTGSRAFTAGQLSAVGLNTVADIVNARQITASP